MARQLFRQIYPLSGGVDLGEIDRAAGLLGLNIHRVERVTRENNGDKWHEYIVHFSANSYRPLEVVVDPHGQEEE